MILKKIHGGAESDVISRAEFALVDDFRIIAFMMLAMSAAMARMGCKTLSAVTKGSSGFADLVFKKNLFRIGIVVLTMSGIVFYGRECAVLFESERAQTITDQPLDLDERSEDMIPSFDEEEEEPEFEQMAPGQRGVEFSQLSHPEDEQVAAAHSHWKLSIQGTGRHLKSHNHGQQRNSRDSKHHGRCPVPYIIFAVIAFHTVTLHWFRTALHELDSVNPKKTANKAKKVKATIVRAATESVAAIAPVAQHVDKQGYYPVVQQPSQYVVSNNHNMV